ncbi:uncharacterized protein CTHT_0012890 [Thermochaetoides thermophila DSM 1495]|uniref:Mid2 domain-containing protein n=1 Tax=Chaetomium thermophilum (strain DSM 1495 / CBS 144.50 / IMI 039719) TaxID=759272 RepID=G0S1A3_CHATD|nr:hypothetical protein CTHT_0012890 [Thermochaetoides thermophila DSM 1495]EGS22813.1 hypothetical protein CTHT_0012890 [Thermochaetoides thermophila DSM 1495]
MKLRGALKLLIVGLSAASVAEATYVNIYRDSRHKRSLQRRQDDDEGNDSLTLTLTTALPTLTTEPTLPTSTRSPPQTSSTSSLPTSTEETTATRTTTSPTDAQTSPTETATDSGTSSVPGETSTITDKTEKPKPTPTTITSTYYETITNTDGSKVTKTHEVVTTQTPDLADSDDGKSESGMSTQTRNTVIGVVVGIGGAIVLGGLAFVVWRIWGRRRNQEENEVLMDYGSPVEKPESGGSLSGRTPFQSTLESYHAPTHVNQASNF